MGPLKTGTIAPFVYDGLQARVASDAGFEAIYMTGFGTAASFGMPDVGLLTMTEMVERARVLAKAVDIPLICDADTGYGNPINVIRAVESFEAAGACAIHIEDQAFPKRCGFLDGKEVIESPQMLAKIRAAVAHRSSADFLIIARTDALQPEGWDSAEARARAYIDAGADMIFVDGIRRVEDLDTYCQRLGDLPRLYNGSLEPTDALVARGFELIIHPGTMMAVFEAMQSAYRELAESGRITSNESDGFGDLISLLGVPETLATARQYDS